jgi:cytidylate kinase
MIIWINGAFGSGKTQTAFELHRRLPNSFVYDPENPGYFIRKNIPKELGKGDFQDYEMWREINFSMLKYIDENYKGIIIVPMTIVSPQYFKEIVEKLRGNGIKVTHFALNATRETLLKRLKTRGDGKESWPAKQIDRCIEGLKNEVFKQHIETDKLSIEEVVEKIALLSDIKLLPDDNSKIRKAFNRVRIKLKHIRW